MGSQRPLGCACGLRRTVVPLQLPGVYLRGSSSMKLLCLRRRRICPSAAFDFPEVLAASWSDAESLGVTSAVPDSEQLRPAAADSHGYVQRQQAPHADLHQERLRQRQQAPKQLGQRLVPTTPVASAIKLPARSGVSGIGVALGILLTVAFQLVGRWLQRQRWAHHLVELLDLRRSSASSASTSGKQDSAAAAAQRPYGLSGASASSGVAGDSSGAAVSGGRSAFMGGSGAGNLPGSPLGTMDSGASGLGAGSGPTTLSAFANVAGAGAAAAFGPGGIPLASASLPLPPGPGSDPGESVEWVNMCWRKVWRVYQRGLERWIIDLLQPVFDGLVKDGSVPRWLCRLRVVELTLDHEAPYFSNMRRRNSRKDSDLNGVVDLRYTGGARMLLMLELGEGRWRFKVPVLVSDLDLECQMWLKLRLAPMCPWIGTISLAFVGPPNVKVQLSPYNRVRLMRVPVVQNYLRKLLTVDLPALMVLPQRLEINIPPSVTTIAEAAVGRDTIMRAVASAVLQADAVEAALLAALPLGPQTPAGGVTLPEAFKGELSVTLREARNLPVWGFPGQSNPFVRLVLGDQAVQSRREGDTSHPGRHRAPVWNQEFQFLVEDPDVQVLEMLVKDSHLTGRTEVGRASIKLVDLLAAQHAAEGGKVAMWVPLQPPAPSYGISGGEPVPTGDVLMELSYKAFDEDEHDSGCREAENFSKQAAAQAPITDIRSAAAASSRAAVAASAAVSAIAMTRAAAARAAARAARVAQEAAAAAAGAAKGAVGQGASIIAQQQQQQLQNLVALPPPRQLPASTTPTTMATQLPRAAIPAAPALSSTSDSSPAERTSAALDRSTAATTQLVTAATTKTFEGALEAGQGGGGGDGSMHVTAVVVSGAGAASGRGSRSRVGAVAEEELEGKDEGPELLALPEEVQARALSLSAATASAAVLSARASATAVLERPPALVGSHAVAPGSGGSRGHSYNHRLYEGVADGGAAASNHWRRRHSSSSGGDDGGGSDGDGGSGGNWNDHAVGASSPASFDVEVVEPPHGPASGGSGLSTSSSVSQLQQQQQPIDVSADILLVEPPSELGRSGVGKAQGQEAASAVGSGSNVGDGVAGPVLGALAHLTASAQSLTATAIGKARESLSQKSQPPPPGQHEQVQSDAAGKDPSGVANDSGDGSWLAAIVSRLPRYGGAGGGHQHSHMATEEDNANAVVTAAADRPANVTGDNHPWWQFWVPKGGASKLHDAEGDSAATADASVSSHKSGAAAEPSDAAAAGRSKPWWQFWPDGERAKTDEDEDEGTKQRQGADKDGASKPVEAIYIPPDLPLEEIAAEVQRLKEDSWRERSDHVSNLWMKAVERNDRKWLMLAAFLLSVAVGLLTVVAWRLEQLEHLQASAPHIALMTMQAALQALEQQISSGSGSL